MDGDAKIVIDELKICFNADAEQLNQLQQISIGCYEDFYGYRFYRITNDRFRYYFEVSFDNQHMGIIKFGCYTDVEDAKTYVYYRVNNEVLYHEEALKSMLDLPQRFGWLFNNYTAIDVALDTKVNIPSIIKKLMRNKDITTIINGKALKERKQIIKGLFFEYSSTLKRLCHPSITIKQKKAEKNKNDGIIVQAYDKKAEITNNSDKEYILDYNGNPKRLYRLEVRLHYRELKDYFNSHGLVPDLGLVFSDDFLEDLFFYHLSSVVRFTKKRRKLDWRELLRCNGRV